VDDVDEHVTPAEKAAVAERMIHSVVGSPAAVREGVERFAALTAADELMVVSNIYDHDARRRSYEILAEAVPH
jgi:alkanesulfonate monooxygenase SsuD/methylene tetrahydromethanopterin reductase-like flavin-dependent oxidoreductase (luciferase family)